MSVRTIQAIQLKYCHKGIFKYKEHRTSKVTQLLFTSRIQYIMERKEVSTHETLLNRRYIYNKRPVYQIKVSIYRTLFINEEMVWVKRCQICLGAAKNYLGCVITSELGKRRWLIKSDMLSSTLLPITKLEL